MMTRLLLVEDHVLVRQSIRAFLEGEGFEVIGEAGSGAEAVQLAADLKPELVIMDIHLPEMSGIEATRRIRQQNSTIHVIALTAYNEKIYQRALSDAGSDAFVLKTAEFSELLTVINRVLATRKPPRYFKDIPDRAAAANPLTEREVEVVECAARGWTNKQIGTNLGISDRTVQVHLQAIYTKLNVTSRSEAVLRALVLGLISQPDGGI